MKTCNYFLLALLLLVVYMSASGQNASERIKKIKVSQTSILETSSPIAMKIGHLLQVNALALGIKVLLTNIRREAGMMGTWFLEVLYPLFSPEFQLSSKEKSSYNARPNVRLSVIYLSAELINGNFAN